MREIIPNILKFMGWACFASAALYGTLMLADLMLGRSMDEIKFLSCAASFVAWPTFISLALNCENLTKIKELLSR